MTIDDAIKLLTVYSENMETDLIDTEYAAIKLGIEALKLYMALKATGGVPKRFSGIGETQE